MKSHFFSSLRRNKSAYWLCMAAAIMLALPSSALAWGSRAPKFTHYYEKQVTTIHLFYNPANGELDWSNRKEKTGVLKIKAVVSWGKMSKWEALPEDAPMTGYSTKVIRQTVIVVAYPYGCSSLPEPRKPDVLVNPADLVQEFGSRRGTVYLTSSDSVIYQDCPNRVVFEVSNRDRSCQ